jgi:cholera toxin transcriptional activator
MSEERAGSDERAGPDLQTARRYRFGIFEADSASGELRRQGLRVRLNAQPFQLLLLLLERPGNLLTREEIASRLWPDGTFVDYEHGVNSAINRIREALGDTAANPRFVETLARRGYRFIAPVERIAPAERIDSGNWSNGETANGFGDGGSEAYPEPIYSNLLATPQDLPKAPYVFVQAVFLLFQLMYLAFYIGALANLRETQNLLEPLANAEAVFYAILITATILIPVRVFALCAALFRAPRFREKFLKLWPLLLFFDVLWSLSPFLLLHHINYGLAIACMALLVYSPFAQRSIVLMGAGRGPKAN